MRKIITKRPPRWPAWGTPKTRYEPQRHLSACPSSSHRGKKDKGSTENAQLRTVLFGGMSLQPHIKYPGWVPSTPRRDPSPLRGSLRLSAREANSRVAPQTQRDFLGRPEPIRSQHYGRFTKGRGR